MSSPLTLSNKTSTTLQFRLVVVRSLSIVPGFKSMSTSSPPGDENTSLTVLPRYRDQDPLRGGSFPRSCASVSLGPGYRLLFALGLVSPVVQRLPKSKSSLSGPYEQFSVYGVHVLSRRLRCSDTTLGRKICF